jgi:cbb3-type cytochrome oxidase maturation protein
METRLKLMRILIGLGGALLVAAPSPALAHENVGGDELAAANWMLVGAMVTIIMGLIAGFWAWRSGQFTNIEESKYRMLEIADDYDAIMAEAAHRETRPNEASRATAPQTPSAPTPAQAGRADSTAHV